jgi:signal transduction histidine kinase
MEAMKRFWSWAWLALQVAALELVVVGGTALGTAQRVPPGRLDPLGFALLAVAAGAFALSRPWPLAAFGLALAATVAYIGLGYSTEGPVILGVMATLFGSVRAGRLGRSLALGGVTVVAFAIPGIALRGVAAAGLDPGTGALLVAVAAPLAAGHALANRRAYVAAVEDRARLAEQSREEHAQRRVAEERLRIARDLHDVLSHTISVINVQAGVAAYVMADHPEQAQQALLTIKETSKQAMQELRSLLGVLRDTEEAAALAPAPGLEQLGALVETARRSGLPTTVTVRGPARPLPPAADLAAYRIIQESLTNAIRHAGSASASVTLAYEGDRLVVEICDDGHGAEVAGNGADGGGHGLTGMGERAAAAGGELEAGPLPGGGFRVRACLPLEGGR